MLKHVKKCPQCGSVEVTLWMGAQAGMIYSCKDCGYRGPLVIEEDLDLKEKDETSRRALLT